MNSISNKDLEQIWNMVYNLALNFLHDESAAEDTAQEIFLKAGKSTDSFRNESKLSTWIYRIAYNYLIDQTRLKFKDEISFEMFEYDVNNFQAYDNELNLNDEELRMYVEEVKVGCTKAMLQCLDDTDRFVYILGKVFDFSSRDGAEICGLSNAAFRKRLSRSSEKLKNFMSKNCGLINPGAKCKCRKRISIALERGRINPDLLLHRTDSPKILDYMKSMNEIDYVAAVFRDNPYIDKTAAFTDELRAMVMNAAENSI